MPDASTLLLFVVAALALLVTPGPAVLYIVARSIDQGRLAGIVSILGVASDGAWVLVAGSAGNWLKSNLGFLRAQRYFTGGVFIALGLVAAFSGSRGRE